MHDRVRWERPRQARAGPCRPGLLTALPHRVSIRYWLHGTSVLQVAIMLLNHVPFTISLSPMVHNNVDTCTDALSILGI